MNEKTDEKLRSCGCAGNSETKDIQRENEPENSDIKVRRAVREQYASIATGKPTATEPEPAEQKVIEETREKMIGYSQEELESIPEESNLGLGSGNPVALASIKSGEVVVDLGSGAGVDCFLASKKVGSSGKVIGVDMTPEMIDKARKNARKGSYSNVEFRLGEIEHLPVGDNTTDLVISNCVINLAPDKSQVFKDAYRVLKPGGRLMVSDIILAHEFPAPVKEAIADLPGCVSMAWVADDYLAIVRKAGFEQVEIVNSTVIAPRMKPKELGTGNRKRTLVISGKRLEVELTPEEDEKLLTAVMSAHVKAVKPI